MNKLWLVNIVMLLSTTLTAQNKMVKTIWEGLFVETVEQNLITVGDQITVRGYITGTGKEKQPLEIRYEMGLTATWDFLWTRIYREGKLVNTVRKESDRWLVNNDEREDLAGCQYIDINLTPFTNSLPINNLKFTEQTRQKTVVVFIDLFNDTITRSHQRYTRLSNDFYEYENLDSGFKRTLKVDEYGIVQDYPGIWRRLSANVFSDALISDTPAVAGAEAGMYDWLIGSWSARIMDYKKDGSKVVQKGKWIFSWVLAGYALQDVLIVVNEDGHEINEFTRYGTSIRFFNKRENVWDVTWINPVTGGYDRLKGKKVNDQLVHLGKKDDGTLQRWSFDSITTDSFHWKGEWSRDDGKTWTMDAEFFLTRD